MDKIEQLYKKHRAAFDVLEPKPALWDHLAQDLAQKPPNTTWWARNSFRLAAVLVVLLGIGLGTKLALEKPPIGLDYYEISPDISLQTPEGQEIALSDLEGKVVLVEFWASWCNVCSQKNCEELLPVYDTYKEKGFEIYAVSVDEDQRQWVSGIETHKLPWIHVSDLRGLSSPISQQFQVEKTPTTYLLDEKRRIIGKNLSREELEVRLGECYSGN